jgi:hypothetical protein
MVRSQVQQHGKIKASTWALANGVLVQRDFQHSEKVQSLAASRRGDLSGIVV